MELGTIADNRAMSDECCNGDRVERVLSAQQWRVLRALLQDGSRPADPILCEDETLDYEEYLTVCYELHHVLLPAFAAGGLVTFDRVEDEVRPGPRFDEVRRLFGQIDDHHDE
jgi:hypothetical protein